MHRYLKKIIKYLLAASLKASSRERQEEELKEELRQIIPDFSAQYTSHSIDMLDVYMVEKVRSQHAFQVSLAMRAINLLKRERRLILRTSVIQQGLICNT